MGRPLRARSDHIQEGLTYDGLGVQLVVDLQLRGESVRGCWGTSANANRRQ